MKLVFGIALIAAASVYFFAPVLAGEVAAFHSLAATLAHIPGVK